MEVTEQRATYETSLRKPAKQRRAGDEQQQTDDVAWTSSLRSTCLDALTEKHKTCLEKRHATLRQVGMLEAKLVEVVNLAAWPACVHGAWEYMQRE